MMAKNQCFHELKSCQVLMYIDVVGFKALNY